MDLEKQIIQIKQICTLIEEEKEYLTCLKSFLPELNREIMQMIQMSQDVEINFQINEQFVIQVLQDIIYGIEKKDNVYLLDTLRYGLLEIFAYINEELKNGDNDE